MNWLLRGLLLAGGMFIVLAGWQVMRGAYYAQQADAVSGKLWSGRKISVGEVRAAIASFDRAVAAEPSARRYLQRSEFLAGAALIPTTPVPPPERTGLLHRADSDLKRGLADAPARTTDWLRLAVVRQALNGSSRDVLPPLLMSLDTGLMMSPIWRVRTRIILDNWAYFTEAQKEKLRDHVVTMWRRAPDRRWFGWIVYEQQVDELILRDLLRDEPNAKEELSRWIRDTNRR